MQTSRLRVRAREASFSPALGSFGPRAELCIQGPSGGRSPRPTDPAHHAAPGFGQCCRSYGGSGGGISRVAIRRSAPAPPCPKPKLFYDRGAAIEPWNHWTLGALYERCRFLQAADIVKESNGHWLAKVQKAV